MGILNVTPDSFSDGSHESVTNYELRITNMIKEGADIIDVGGESTGPGSKDVSLEEEMNRLKPVIDYIEKNKLTDKTIFSIDTYKAPVARYALEHGFEMVNDVTALRGDADMIDVLLEFEPFIVLMYSKDSTPRTSTEDLEYDDVIASIKVFLINQIVDLIDSGFPEDKIIVDPGMGMFVSSDPKYSHEILERLPEFKLLGYPVLVGISRKSFLGGELGSRDKQSAELSFEASQNGASIVRMHDVKRINKLLHI